MRESSRDLEQLQKILDRSFENSGTHLRSIFSAASRLNASEVVEAFSSVFEMHIGVVTGSGAPLVAPIDGVIFRGLICFGFPGSSLRARLIRNDDRVSASYQNQAGSAFIVHGRARPIEVKDPFFEQYTGAITDLYTGIYGEGWKEWREKRDSRGEYNGFIEPKSMFAKRGG